MRSFVPLTVAICFTLSSFASGKDVTRVYGHVIDGIFKINVPGAKLVLKDRDTHGSTTYTNAAGNFSEDVKIGETHTVNITYVYSYHPYRVRNTQEDQPNNLKYTVSFPNYYDATADVNLWGQNSEVETNFEMEIIVNPFVGPGACKLDDDLFFSLGESCVDVHRSLRWGQASTEKMTYQEAKVFCSPQDQKHLPALGQIQTVNNGNNLKTHFNYDGTRKYWAFTAHEGAGMAYASDLVGGKPIVSKFATKQYAVCLLH